MSAPPRLPIHIGDYLKDTPPISRVNWEHHGIYLLALMITWNTPGCRLPDDPAWLASRFGCTVDEYHEHVEPVLKMYFRKHKKTLRQKRLDEERKFVESTSEKQSKRAKSRWNKEKGKSHGKSGGTSRGNAEKHAEKHAESDAPIPIPIQDSSSSHLGEKKAAPRTRAREGPAPAETKQVDDVEVAYRAIVKRVQDVIASPNTLNLSLLRSWIRQGCDPKKDIVPAIQEVMDRKKDGPPKSLKYFEDHVMEFRDRRTKLNGHGTGTSPVADDPAERERREWRVWIRHFRSGGRWPEDMGPKPGEPGCRAPPDILAEFEEATTGGEQR